MAGHGGSHEPGLGAESHLKDGMGLRMRFVGLHGILVCDGDPPHKGIHVSGGLIQV